MTNAVIVLDPQGSVLATSGLPEVLGRADIEADAGIRLPGVVRALDVEDLARVLADAGASRPGSQPRSLVVRPVEGASDEPHELRLHRIGDSFIMGVLTPASAATGDDLEASESVLQRIWSGLGEGMALATRGGKEGMPTIVAVNAAFGTLFGLDPEDARGKPLIEFLAPANGAALVDRIRRRVGQDGESLNDLTLVRRGDAQATVVQWELAPVRGRDGRTQALMAIFREASSAAPWTPTSKTLDEDPLTGLPNRNQLMNRLERSVERALHAMVYSFAIVGIEVDGLRAVERRLGPAVANALLDALVWRIRQELRPGDLIARVGSERLAVLLDFFAPRGNVDDVLKRIQHATEDPYSIGGERIGLRSIGAAGPIWSSEHAPSTATEVLDELESAVARASARVVRNGGAH